MTQQDKGKNIFQNAIDAVSNRDEKAAIEAAMKRGQELEQKVAELTQTLTQTQQGAAQTAQKLAAAEQAATQTAQRLAASDQKAAQLTTDLAKAQADLATTRSDLATAKNTVTVAEQRLAATNAELQKYVSADQAKKIAEAAAAAAQAQVLAEHTLKADETLSHLALKYYGSAGEAYWRVIYEANKALIGDNPGRVRPGMLVKIPVLPDALKKK